jgi:hypothetical protein
MVVIQVIVMQHLIDKLAEQHIQAALEKGDFDHLRGAGQPLRSDDWERVPESVRAGYHVLKNAGFIPPELVQRKEALQLCDLLATLRQAQDDVGVTQIQDKIRQIELKLKLMGMNTQFIHQYIAKTEKIAATKT